MIKFSVTLAAMVIIAACGKREEAPERGDQVSGMQGMMMRSDSMMPMMRAHLDSMATDQPQFPSGMASHEAMASRMLDAMGADMTAMGMKGDSAWVVLTDSIKRDLAELPGLTGQRLQSRLRAHVERFRRLMVSHQEMMRRTM